MIVAIVFLVTAGFVIYLYSLAWPSSLWLTFAVVVWLLTRKSKLPLFTALAKATFPFLWGLSAVVMLQIYFNLHGIETYQLHALEATLLEVKDTVPAWTDFAWWQFCTIIAVLFSLHLTFLRYTPLKHFLWTIKLLSKVGAVLGTLACFTFFGQQAASQPVHKAEAKLVVQIANLRDQNWRDSIHVLATQAVTEQFSRMDAETRRALIKNAQLLTQRPVLNNSADQLRRADMQRQANQLLKNLLALHLKEAVPVPEVSIEVPAAEPPHKQNAELFERLSTERRQKAKIETEHDEARAALDAVVSRITNGLTEPAIDLVKGLAEYFLGGYSNFLVERVKTISSKTTSAYFDKLRKPLIDHLVDYGMRCWEPLRAKRPREIAHELMLKARVWSLKEAAELISEAKQEGSRMKLEHAKEKVEIAREITSDRQSGALSSGDAFEGKITRLLAQIDAAQKPVSLAEANRKEKRLKNVKRRQEFIRKSAKPRVR